jgi:hypothetical protein
MESLHKSIVEDIRIIIDDISDGEGTEYRASIYDDGLDLVAEAWEETQELAVLQALKDYYAN